MKILKPTHTILKKHIDCYRIVDGSTQFFKVDNALAFQGVKPELILILDGYITFNYLNKKQSTNKSVLFSFIKENVALDLSNLKSFVLIQFKPFALASLKPFVSKESEFLMQQSVCFAEDVFGNSLNELIRILKFDKHVNYGKQLDAFFISRYNSEFEGFISEFITDYGQSFSLKEIMQATNYSYSTIERLFKKDIGLTPKTFQSLKRFKTVIEEIYITKNEDWMHYVNKYDYYDQSHFIKDIKRHSSFTPSQLMSIVALPKYRY